MPTRKANPQVSTPLAWEYSGKWVVWSADHSEILLSGESIQELWRLVTDRGIVDPIFEKVPRFDVRFVGRT